VPRTAHPRGTFLSESRTPTRVIAALDEPQQASYALHSPLSFEGLTLGLVGGAGGAAAPQPPGLSPRNLACLRAPLAAALFRSS